MMTLFADLLKNIQAIEKSSSICELEWGWSDEDTSSSLEPTEEVQKPQSTDYPRLLGGNSWVWYCEGHRFNSITNQPCIGTL